MTACSHGLRQRASLSASSSNRSVPFRGSVFRPLSRPQVCSVQCVAVKPEKPKLSYVGATLAGERGRRVALSALQALLPP